VVCTVVTFLTEPQTARRTPERNIELMSEKGFSDFKAPPRPKQVSDQTSQPAGGSQASRRM